MAGLSCALAAAPTRRVVLLTKDTVVENNTAYAQGGVAAALAPDDSPELHAEDTKAAGAGLSDDATVYRLVHEGPERVKALLHLGARFDAADGHIALGREAAHSSRRIAHAGGDATGREIHRTLQSAVAVQMGIALRERTLLADILVAEGHVVGALLLHLDTGALSFLSARAIVLATGGVGALWERTTNPLVATGDGIAAAYRAGATVSDMEFVQFHPTALVTEGDPLPLVSEAVRGEGAVLRDASGVAFMAEYHPSAELAPRDIVSRSIVDRCNRTGSRHAFLDCAPIGAERFEARFPTILHTCLANGLDPRVEPIPVTPAAHYHMGGIWVGPDSATAVEGLYAAGECACTGVHGANRLASNSLLEGLVFGSISGLQAAEMSDSDMLDRIQRIQWMTPPSSDSPMPEEDVVARIGELRDLMWRRVGILRDRQGLEAALSALAEWRDELGAPQPRRADLELANMLQVSELIVRSALRREESRGAQYRTDFPERDDLRWRCRILRTFRAGADGADPTEVEEIREVIE